MASAGGWCFLLATANLKRSTTVVFDMNDKRKTTVSKFLSKHLRHEPEALGLTLRPGGWVAIDDLLAAATKHGFPITPAELDDVIRTNPKQRFSFDETGTLIRANQGHSTAVDLQLEPA